MLLITKKLVLTPLIACACIANTASLSATPLPDSIDIINQLQKIEKTIPLEYNKWVGQAIQKLVASNREKAQYLVNISLYATPKLKKWVSTSHLPEEIAYLPFAVSGMNGQKTDEAGRSGYWQLTYIVAKHYGLQAGKYIDERRHLKLSTMASIKYIADLNQIYHNWRLNILAFVTSPAEVNAAMLRANTKTDFWKIYRQIKDPAKKHYPQYLATLYLLHYNETFNLSPELPQFVQRGVDVNLSSEVYLPDVADKLNIPLQKLKKINGIYRTYRIVVNDTYTLKVPANKVSKFHKMEKVLYASAKNRFYNPDILSNNPTVLSTNAKEDGNLTKNNNEKYKVLHKVRRGESLYKIAKEYDVSMDKIRQWNQMSKNVVYANDVMIVGYKSSRKAAKQASYQTILSPRNQQSKNTTTYRVRNGDTLWSIAQKFSGVTAEEIQQINNLHTTLIHPGQVLKIK